MPPCCRSNSGYRGVRARPNGTFYAKIRSGDEHIGLGTFETAHEVARAYDAVAWRLGRSRRSMNFDDVTTRQQAEMLAPPPPAVTRDQRELEQWLIIAERDERLHLEWREQFPEDVAAMEAFYAEKAEEKAAVKVAKKADRKERQTKSTARKKEREEKTARKAARKKEEKKNGAVPSTIVSCRLPLPSTGHPLRCRRRPYRLASGTPSTRSSVVLVCGGGGVFSSYLQC
jgi:hypothetical protein